MYIIGNRPESHEEGDRMARKMTQAEKAEECSTYSSQCVTGYEVLLPSSSIAPGHFQIDGRLFERVIGR